MLIRLVLIGFLSTLPACATYVAMYGGAPTPPAKIIINTGFDVPAHALNVHIQAGEFKDYNLIEVYRSNCNLVFKTSRRQAWKVRPQTCDIRRFVEQTDYVGLAGRQFAALKLSGGVDLMAAIYRTQFNLQCPIDPDFIQMHCQHWDDPFDTHYLNASELEKTLAPYLTISK